MKYQITRETDVVGIKVSITRTRLAHVEDAGRVVQRRSYNTHVAYDVTLGDKTFNGEIPKVGDTIAVSCFGEWPLPCCEAKVVKVGKDKHLRAEGVVQRESVYVSQPPARSVAS